MFKLTINSQAEGQFWLEKQTQAEVDDYIQWAYDSAHWGKPNYIESIPEVLEIKDELGEIIQAAAPEQVIEHAAEYIIEITDITSLVQQEKLNKESLEFLAQTDWYIVRELETGVLAPVEIKTSRAEARARVVR